MDAFSYLSVLISIILALNDAGPRRLYWVHAVWVVNLFLYLVVAWWIFYRWRNQQPWTTESSLDEFVNYKTHYYSNHRAFFVLFVLYSPVDYVDTMLKGIPHLFA